MSVLLQDLGEEEDLNCGDSKWLLVERERGEEFKGEWLTPPTIKRAELCVQRRLASIGGVVKFEYGRLVSVDGLIDSLDQSKILSVYNELTR